MQLVILAVGQKMPQWVEKGFGEYVKRMPPECKIILKEIRAVDRAGGKPAETVMQQEGDRIKAAIPKSARLIVLDEHGKDVTTMALSHKLLQWQQEGHDVAFIIGGADGLDPELKSQADEMLRISSLTLPHGMVRVVLAEQLYRAWTITQNHPYHRT